MEEINFDFEDFENTQEDKIYAIFTDDVETLSILDLVLDDKVEESFERIYESYCKYRCKNKLIHLLDFHLEEEHNDFYREKDENVFAFIEENPNMKEQLYFFIYMLDNIGVLCKRGGEIVCVTEEERFQKIINKFSNYNESIHCPVCNKEIKVSIKDIKKNI
ncbi:MAG: hypothetical protein KatS3mg002_0986 [Candidatus Woesearchaeota archaeon]|nr:MAG: hypothetical protein KatS3mg002_0986 [Candidatus Woesearchaeota archaeon]